jgi:transcriptional regulator of arginine metabolism
MSMPADSKIETQERLLVLKQLIREGSASTQEELCEALSEKEFKVTQSTVSRDLRRIGAIKTTNSEGETIYQLPDQHHMLPPQVVTHTLTGLLTDIQANEYMIVLHTTPGSASLVARHLDNLRSSMGILGTLAGDDAIFVVPGSAKKISKVIDKIKQEFY